MNELELLKNKIKYRASYRGTKEMDILLTSFVSSAFKILNLSELKELDTFINSDDEDIYNFYFNDILMPSYEKKRILNLFKSFKVK